MEGRKVNSIEGRRKDGWMDGRMEGRTENGRKEGR